MMFPLAAGNASEWTGPTGNNTYLLTGAPSVLIDAGIGRAEHVAAIAGHLGSAPLDLILLTHHHIDHVAGVPALLARWPSAVVRGGGSADPLQDGESIAAGSGRLRALHTPGHAPDHFCFFDEASADLFCGDLVRIGGTVVIPATRGGSLRDYLRSLERVRALAPARLLPAHGPVIDDPRGLIDQYIAHRREREAQVLEALAAGCRTPAEIVSRIYVGLSPSLRPAAEETVRAHLQKLDEDR
jgi:glyoxylase-like metal-dependent hydrolase (beta-lactamase superfamily II)